MDKDAIDGRDVPVDRSQPSGRAGVIQRAFLLSHTKIESIRRKC